MKFVLASPWLRELIDAVFCSLDRLPIDNQSVTRITYEILQDSVHGQVSRESRTEHLVVDNRSVHDVARAQIRVLIFFCRVLIDG